MSNGPRDYKKEYDNYHAKPDQKRRRALRNAARKMMEKEGRVTKGDNNDVDHINKSKNGPLSNRRDNLRVIHQSLNRSRK